MKITSAADVLRITQRHGISPAPTLAAVPDPPPDPKEHTITKPAEEPEQINGHELLLEIHTWLGRYIKTAQPADLVLLVLWAAHTHLCAETYTTPRLLLDSPAPGSGKTTVLDHLQRLCFSPVQAASLSSPSLLARLLEKHPRTILVDEADRTLHPRAEGVAELLAVLNSGYRFGASRPVLVPDRDGGWVANEMSTFGPVAMAGNSPNLPPDTRSRCIRVLLLPDTAGEVEDSDWQEIEVSARNLGSRIATWADQQRATIRESRPEYPEGLRGRNRERWAPLLKVAAAAGDYWKTECIKLINADLEEQKLDQEEGLMHRARHVLLLQDIAAVWPADHGDTKLFPTLELISALKAAQPGRWGPISEHGELTVQGLGRMLVNHFNIRAGRERDGARARGYRRGMFTTAWDALGVRPPDRPDEPDVPDEPGEPAQ
ncbi:DUF3631 domain-containing protein [Corynebacterium hansenii]|uniref:DUF3631 domain-containing protein n=1 Tax=Corynebacterium hansenii TaxID=394964 RepID=A0ABV7ZP10_9CORY|nr:DUF3631 domain-containing protein [Corynebacterium hansenii]WJZ00494.1 hypothetical protein CHAN_09450 [Corynebacterium hansenii]